MSVNEAGLQLGHAKFVHQVIFNHTSEARTGICRYKRCMQIFQPVEFHIFPSHAHLQDTVPVPAHHAWGLRRHVTQWYRR